MRRTTVALVLLILSFSLAAEAAAPPPVPRGPEVWVNADPGTAFDRPAIAAFPDGGFVVIWQSASGVRARFLDARRRPGREIVLPVDGLGHAVATTSNGFIVAWATSTPSSPATGIFARRFDRDGTPLGKRIRVSNLSTSERYDPVIASGPGGSFAVAWTADVRATLPEGGPYTYSHAVGRIFAADGTPVTREIILQEGLPVTDAGDDAVDASSRGLLLKPDGTLLAQVYMLPSSGCFQSYLVQRQPGEEPELLEPLTSGFCHGPPYRDSSAALVMRPDGGVIAWAEDDLNEQGRGIFGRSFAANGTPRTETYRINLSTAGLLSPPAIAAPRQGPIVVVWYQAIENLANVLARVLAPRP